MLTRLIIRNYAIIPELDISFDSGLSIITGETGAGKSILLGALGLALGKRADNKSIPSDASKCIVEAHFELQNESLKDRFEIEELDFDRQLICRRELSAGGKSRSFVNDTPVSLKVLQEISSTLIELHHQHDNLALQSKDHQVQVLDTISKSNAQAVAYHAIYSDWTRTRQQLEKLKEDALTSSRRKEFLQFQLNELTHAKLTVGEIATLEETQQTLEHAETIQEVITLLESALQGGPHAVLNQLNALLRQVHAVTPYFAPLSPIGQRLEAVRIELDDIALESNRLDGPGGNDPSKLNRTQTRLSQLYSLMKKYQCRDESELLHFFNQTTAELQALSNVHEEIPALEAKIEKSYQEVLLAGQKLSKLRKTGATKILPGITSLLHELGMPNAKFEIELQQLPSPQSSGMDDIQFLFSANKGMSLQPLHSVASGGELSRLSLALKSVYADQSELPTVVFDEIDTGISGEVAWRMGQLILKMSRGPQILMITHSPQIAAHAAQQYHVSKVTSGDKDISAIQKLNAKQRVQEIAKMLSGDPPSKAAVQNAQGLIEKAYEN